MRTSSWVTVNISPLAISGQNTNYKLDGINATHFRPRELLHVNKSPLRNSRTGLREWWHILEEAFIRWSQDLKSYVDKTTSSAKRPALPVTYLQ